jgi:hypothetical protein
MSNVVLRNKFTSITGLLFALSQWVLTFKPLPFHLTNDQLQWVSFLSGLIFIVHSAFTKDATVKDGTIPDIPALPPELPTQNMELTQNADLISRKAP